ncbi:WD40 repeat domain-containing protein [Nocardia alni]|uniref:WD40 repeat domain-containing protein n=1 Tax=Nocardia alni TaxID=2815723 RepID=UPI001C2353D9|nr:WD40 repeat domain-containing protein [Nocardia alni]
MRAAVSIAAIAAVLLGLVADALAAPNHIALQLRSKFNDPNAGVADAAFSPDGRSLITLVTDSIQVPDGPTPAPVTTKTVELWNVRTGHLDWTLQDADGRISRALFGPDGHTLVLLVDDTVELWDVRTHQPITTLDACSDGDVSCPDQRHDCLQDQDDCMDDHSYRQAAFSPDGRTLAVSGRWGNSYSAVDIWDLRTRKLVDTFPTGLPDGLEATMDPDGLYFSADSRRLIGFGVVFGQYGLQSALATWDVSTGQVLAQTTFGLDRAVNTFDLSHDRRHLAIVYNADRQAVVEIWEVASGKMDSTIDTGAGDVNAVAFGPEDRTLAVAVDDNSILLADAAGNRPPTKLTGPATLRFAAVSTAAMSPDGRTVTGVTYDGIALLWESRSQQFIAAKTPGCAKKCAYTGDVAYTSDNRLLAMVRQDGVIDIIRLR